MSFDKDKPSRMGEKSRKRRRFARRLRSAGRRLVNPSSYDGDGDGFRMNPRTGRDDLPVMPRTQAPSNNGWPDDDDDLELRRAAGLDGPKPKVPQRPKQIERAKEPRKTVRVTGVSKRDMDDLYFDVFEAMKELLAKARDEGKDPYAEDRQLQARKRLVKLHLYLKELLRQKMIAQDGDELAINVTEEELKRLFKGLESMQKEGFMDDNPIYEDLLKQISKAYRQAFYSLPDYNPPGEGKQDSLDIETKVINRRLGRNLLRSARRGATRRPMSRRPNSRRRMNPLKRPQYDGDADGFITNPLTGRDEIPWARDRETPEQAISRFFGGQVPQSIADIVKPANQRSAADRLDISAPSESSVTAMSRVLGDNTPTTYIARQTQQPLDERVALLLQALTDPASKIKKREWGPIAAAIRNTRTSLEAKHGPLKTKADFLKAFGTHAKTVVATSWPQREELTPDELGYFLSLLAVVERAQGRYKDMIMELRYGEGESSYASAESPFRKGQSTATKIGITRVNNTDRIAFNYKPNLFGPDGSITPGLSLKDNIPAQAARAFLEHAIQNPGGRTLQEVYDDAALVFGLGVGAHEGGHGVHFTASRRDVWDITKTDAEVEVEVNQFLTANGPQLAQIMTRRTAIAELEAIRDYRYHLDKGVSPSMIDTLRAAETDPAKKAQLDDLFNRVTRGQAAYAKLQQLPPGSPTRTFMEDLLDKILNGSETPTALRELAYENPNMLDDYFLIMNTPLGTTMQQVVSSILTGATHRDALQSAALGMWAMGQMWDGLTDQQIAAVRKAWKYISSYAKDKNSYYNHAMPGLASVEGIAELISMHMMGIDLTDNIPPEAREVMNAILGWLFGAMDSKTAAIQGIASKSVYDLLCMVRSEDV